MLFSPFANNSIPLGIIIFLINLVSSEHSKCGSLNAKVGRQLFFRYCPFGAEWNVLIIVVNLRHARYLVNDRVVCALAQISLKLHVASEEWWALSSLPIVLPSTGSSSCNACLQYSGLQRTVWAARRACSISKFQSVGVFCPEGDPTLWGNS